MKAYECIKYGGPDVLIYQETEMPKPKDDEVLIKVMAKTVNAADCNARGLTHIPSGLGFLAKLMLGFNKPKKDILGSVLAGEVVSIGKDVKRFKAGDRVYGISNFLGAYAEFECRSEKGALTLIPEKLDYRQAASIPFGALTALYFLKDLANVRKGQKALIKGASGGVGVYAVQLAKYFGAKVTAVCSARNSDFVLSLGADKVIDYKNTDYTKTGEKWDVILDIVVGKTSFSGNKNSLTKNGKYLAIAGGLNDLMQMVWTTIKGGKKVFFGGGAKCENQQNFNLINQLIANGDLKPVVDKSFPFEKIVEAHKYVESGSKKGNVAVFL